MQASGGAQQRVALYSTEGGWLHLSPEQLVTQSLEAKAQGFKGVKIKFGRPHVSEDMARLSAVRAAVGYAFEIIIEPINVSPSVRRFAARDITKRWTLRGLKSLCPRRIWAVTNGLRKARVAHRRR